MQNLLRLWRSLNGPAAINTPGECDVRNFEPASDAPAWLELHNAVYQRHEKARPWTPRDFAREFAPSKGWTPDQMWLAFSVQEPEELVGSVAVAIRPNAGVPYGSIQWLTVAPNGRRRRVASALLDRLETYCWEKGVQCMLAETLSSWTEAVAFYQNRGYSP